VRTCFCFDVVITLYALVFVFLVQFLVKGTENVNGLRNSCTGKVSNKSHYITCTK